MILLLAGTGDGLRLTEELGKRRMPVVVSVTTEAAARPYRQRRIPVRVGPLDRDGLALVISSYRIRVILDATHPYAVRAHDEAQAAADSHEIPYVRYQRPGLILPEHPAVFRVQSHEEAASRALMLGPVVFLTIGGKFLPIYLKARRARPHIRVIARLLPREEHCRLWDREGLPASDLVLMQGPFGAELNRALYRHFDARVLVTKDSREQDMQDKIRPALDLGMQVVIVGRPSNSGISDWDAVLDQVKRLWWAGRTSSDAASKT